ncbi:MAG TPA: MFS transporter [Chitinophagaceae bacterium]|nr:MFS transporter [Chitinophagaceae bacterium]
MKTKIITRTIWILSLVSLFTDMASEMLYPVMPVFLRSIGFSFLLIGVLEGFAEAVAGLSKGYFGKRSDITGKRLPFVQFGYALSAISKPMMAVFIYPLWIFFARTIDRLGKGLRTGARDAMLSDECTKENKGKVFGFHRSMDTMGAVLGPAIALVYLYYYPANYKTLFIIAFFPGVLAILFTLFIKEKKLQKNTGLKKERGSFFAIFSYWKHSSTEYKRLLTGLLLFAMFNSSDVFLLLRMKESGLDDTAVIGVYIFYNLVFALLAYPVGILADKLGLKKIFLAGLFVFAIVYGGFAVNDNLIIFFVLFFLYGLYAASTEGISKAWISNIVSKDETATAIGTYTGLQSICALLASSLTGFLWFKYGSVTTFTITSCVTLFVILYLSQFHKPSPLNKIA